MVLANDRRILGIPSITLHYINIEVSELVSSIAAWLVKVLQELLAKEDRLILLAVRQVIPDRLQAGPCRSTLANRLHDGGDRVHCIR
jgi:hypothetical protein